MESYWKEKRACGFIPNEPSQMQEAFADFVSSKIISMDIDKATDDNEKKKTAFELSGFFLGNSCLLNRSDFVENMSKDFPSKCLTDSASQSFIEDLENMDSAHSAESEVHPGSSKRMNSLFFSDPVIKRALGCDQRESAYENCR